MKKINEQELADFGLTVKNFEPKSNSYKSTLTSGITNQILKMEIGEYLFVSKNEWPLKVDMRQWLNSNRAVKRSRLFRNKVFARKCEGGWIVRRGDLVR